MITYRYSREWHLQCTSRSYTDCKCTDWSWCIPAHSWGHNPWGRHMKSFPANWYTAPAHRDSEWRGIRLCLRMSCRWSDSPTDKYTCNFPGCWCIPVPRRRRGYARTHWCPHRWGRRSRNPSGRCSCTGLPSPVVVNNAWIVIESKHHQLINHGRKSKEISILIQLISMCSSLLGFDGFWWLWLTWHVAPGPQGLRRTHWFTATHVPLA